MLNVTKRWHSIVDMKYTKMLNKGEKVKEQKDPSIL